jgi:hypothetical protein
MNDNTEDIIWDEDSDLGSLEVEEDFFKKEEETEDKEENENSNENEEEEEEEEDTEEAIPGTDESDESDDEEDEDADPVIKNAYEVFDEFFQYLPEGFKKEYTDEGFAAAKEAVKGGIHDEIHQAYLQNLEKNEKASGYLDFLIKTEGEGDVDAWMKINVAKDFTADDLQDNTELQKQVITQLYESQKWEPEDISSKLADLEDLGLLEKESKTALKYVTKNKVEATEQLEISAAQKVQDRRATYDNNLAVLNETFATSGIDAKRKKAVIEDIMQQVPLKNGGEITMLDYRLSQIKNNPEDIIKLANLLHDYEAGKGLNISKMAERSATTKSTRNLRQRLEEIENSSTVTKSKSGKNKNKKNGPDLSELSFA